MTFIVFFEIKLVSQPNETVDITSLTDFPESCDELLIELLLGGEFFLSLIKNANYLSPFLNLEMAFLVKSESTNLPLNSAR